jgi:magnesium-transporting ATPase (P-type)
VVQAGYYLMMVCSQAVHVFVCRTTVISIFEHGVFDNLMTDLGVLIALGLGCLVVYTPFLQTIDGAANPLGLLILYGSLMAFACLWGWTEARKWFSREYPHHWLNDILQW